MDESAATPLSSELTPDQPKAVPGALGPVPTPSETPPPIEATPVIPSAEQESPTPKLPTGEETLPPPKPPSSGQQTETSEWVVQNTEMGKS